MKWFSFVLLLVATAVVGLGTFFPGPGGVPTFVHAWWFKGLGVLLVLGGFKGTIEGIRKFSPASLLCHLGILVLSAGVLIDARGAIVLEDRLAVGETDSTFTMFGEERRMAFSVGLLDYQPDGFRSRVLLDGRHEFDVRPSHPALYKGWIVLQAGDSAFSAGREHKSILTLVKRPGAGWAFVGFGVMLLGLLLLAVRKDASAAAGTRPRDSQAS
jgi:hypothetical protein